MNNHVIRNKLCNDFPQLYVKDINVVLKQTKNYADSYYQLQQQIEENKLNTKKHNSKTYFISEQDDRKLNELRNSSNIECSCCCDRKHILYFAECTEGHLICKDCIRTYVSEQDDRKLNKLRNSSNIECSCCCDTKHTLYFAECTEGHLICKDCIRTHVKNNIYQSSCNIKCIDCNSLTPCSGVYSDIILEQLLDPREFRRYKELKKIDEFNKLSTIDDINIKICEHCGAGTDIGTGEFQQDVLVCMECFKDTCLKCNQVYHTGPCNNVPKTKRHLIEETMSEALIIQCKKCKNNLFKTDGCNKIDCVCGNTYCYICKQCINTEKYNHFIDLPAIMSGINGCSLYDNTSVNNRLVNAVKNVCDYTWDTKEIVKGLL